MRTTGRARRGTRAAAACRRRQRAVPRDAGHRGQRVLSGLSDRERDHAFGFKGCGSGGQDTTYVVTSKPTTRDGDGKAALARAGPLFSANARASSLERQTSILRAPELAIPAVRLRLPSAG